MSGEEKNRTDYEIESFLWAVVPFGGGDIREAIKTALDGGHDGDWLADQIHEFMDSADIEMGDVDPNYVAYDSLLQEARNNIDDITGKDILNDTKEQIDVCGNYMCTSLDFTDEAKDELSEILNEIPEDEYTDAIKWLINEVGYERTINKEEEE